MLNNTIDVHEDLSAHEPDETYLVSAYISKIPRHTPHVDEWNEFVFQYTVCLGIPHPSSSQLYRHGSRSFDTYDEACESLNIYLAGFYARED
tara:strand:+ start:2292 stop:2567 length:276 start_codon:yes stop_codon:yes gene_type:complete